MPGCASRRSSRTAPRASAPRGSSRRASCTSSGPRGSDGPPRALRLEHQLVVRGPVLADERLRVRIVDAADDTTLVEASTTRAETFPTKPNHDETEDMRATQPVPEGYHTLTPHLTVRGGAAALDFYARAFAAEELSRTAAPDGSILNACVRIGDSILMLNDPSSERSVLRAPADVGATTSVIHLYTPDCDALFQRASSAGAEVVMPLMDMFWGDRYGLVRDPFGHVWAIATRREEPTPEELAERMEAMGMR